MQNNQSRFMKHKRAGFQLSTLVLSMLSMMHLHAEDNTVEYVQVIGQAASMDKALKEQKTCRPNQQCGTCRWHWTITR